MVTSRWTLSPSPHYTREGVKPDYDGGSVVNLMASIAAGFGAKRDYVALRALPSEEIAAARNTVLIVIDGLGYRYLGQASEAKTLRAHLRAPITTTFPSTTAAAITAFMTGLAPQQHGLTGWHMYFRELGAVLAVLPFRPRHGGAPLDACCVMPATLFGNAPLFDRLQATSWVVSPTAIVDSCFNVAHSGAARRVGYQRAEELFAVVRDIVRGEGGRHYVYAYFSELDALAHAHGIASEEVHVALGRLDLLFGRLLEEISGSDTLVIATADHGFVDTRPDTVVELDDHPALAETLMLPLCGEPRVAYCYVRPGASDTFESYVESRLGHCATLVRSGELITQGWFGPGAPHPRLADRIGHYTLVMKDGYAVRDCVAGERRRPQIGVHGGATDDELLVPLMVVRC